MGRLVAAIRMHTGAPLLLGVHVIGADDASFHERWVNQCGSSTDLIFFAVHGSLRQDDPTVTFIEGQQMHRRLSLTLVSERSTQGFAIHRHMAERLFLLL